MDAPPTEHIQSDQTVESVHIDPSTDQYDRRPSDSLPPAELSAGRIGQDSHHDNTQDASVHPSSSTSQPDALAQDLTTPVKTKKIIVPASQRLRAAGIVKSLQYKWMYYYCIQSSSSWEPKKIGGFATVSEFWSIYNNLVVPTKLPQLYQYMIFKDGIPPDTDDIANQNGGALHLYLTTKQHDIAIIDTTWEHTLLAMIGEYFELSDLINGLRLVIRSATDATISLWISTTETEKVENIKQEWLQLLTHGGSLVFRPFQKSE